MGSKQDASCPRACCLLRGALPAAPGLEACVAHVGMPWRVVTTVLVQVEHAPRVRARARGRGRVAVGVGLCVTVRLGTG